jgi:hypothetical protein
MKAFFLRSNEIIERRFKVLARRMKYTSLVHIIFFEGSAKFLIGSKTPMQVSLVARTVIQPIMPRRIPISYSFLSLVRPNAMIGRTLIEVFGLDSVLL